MVKSDVTAIKTAVITGVEITVFNNLPVGQMISSVFLPGETLT